MTRPVTGAAAEFRRDGYLVVRGFVDAETVATLLDEVVRDSTGPRAEVIQRDRMEFHNNLYLRSDAIRDFLVSQPLVDLVVPLAGPDLWVRWDQAWPSRPARGRSTGTRTTPTASWSTRTSRRGSR